MNQLSARQRQIADLVATGLTEPQIAERLKISVSTVSSHKNAIYAKLGVRNAVELTHALWKADLS